MRLEPIANPSTNPTDDVDTIEAVRSLVFMANLAAQETTGLLDASRSADELLAELSHPAPHYSAEIYALYDSAIPLSTTEDPLGWLILSAPQQENLHLLEAEIVLDVEFQPLPGRYAQPLDDDATRVISALLQKAKDRARVLGRTTTVVWQQVPLGVPAEAHYLATVLGDAGFRASYTEEQWLISLPALGNSSSPIRIPRMFYDEDFPVEMSEAVAEIYASASKELPHGTLLLEPECWDTGRLREHTEHFRRLGTRNVHAMFLDDSGETAGLSEAWIHASEADQEPEVAELGLTYVLPQFRRTGLGAALAQTVCRHLMQLGITRVYATVGAENQAGRQLLRKLGAKPVSTVVAWQATPFEN